MLTEQEVVAQLNEKIAKKEIKASTSRYLDKIEVLKALLIEQQAELKDLQDRINQVEAGRRDAHRSC
jgi:hypothetical protein